MMDIETKKALAEKAAPETWGRKKKVVVVAILCAALLIGWNIKLSADLNEIKNQQASMQSQLSGIESSLSGELSGFSQQIQDMLKAQDSILAAYSIKEVSRDLKAGTVEYSISATPKTYEPGMKVSFVVNDGKRSVEIRGVEKNHAFSATTPCALTDNITITALITSGKQTQIQIMEKFENLLSESYLWGDEDMWSLLMGLNPKEPPTSDKTQPVFINFNDNEKETTADDVKRLDYYVLVNDKIVASAAGRVGTQTWNGEESNQEIKGYKVDVPLDFLAHLKSGDHVVTAVVITDVYGRRYCANSSAYRVTTNENRLILMVDEQYIYDKSFGVDF